MEDSILIYKIKFGNEKAIETFIKKYYSDIYKYCYRKTSNVETSEDITQETFEKFFKNIDTYTHKNKAKNYLYVISGNLCKNYYKKKKSQSIESVSEKLVSDNEVAISYIDEKLTISECINLLSDELKEVIILYYFQDLKLKEISDILEIKLSLVKYRLRKAKVELKKILNKEDFDL